MKKLLVLAFVAILAVGALAQIDDGIAYYYVGNADVSNNLVVSTGRDLTIPVFFQGGPNVYAGDMCLPIAGRVDIVENWLPAQSNYNYAPFNGTTGPHEWAVHEFGNLNDDSNPTYPNPTGYHSMTFNGFARNIYPDVTLLHSEVPMHILDYVCHIVDNEDLIGQTICDALIAGADPQQGPPNTGDSLGGAGYPVDMTFSCMYFSPNQAPVVISVGDLPTCTYTDFCTEVVLFDNDGDALTITNTQGDWTLVNTDGGPGVPTTYTYNVCFDMEAYCGQCASFTFGFTVSDGANDPVVYEGTGSTAIVGALTVSFPDTVEFVPGESQWVPVYLDACGDCFCLGGFTLTFDWDASVFSVLGVSRGAMLAGGDYWNVVYGVNGPGTARATFINNLNNCEDCNPICDINPDQALFSINFVLDAGQNYPVNFCALTCFDGSTFQNGNISDAEGYHVWFNNGCQDPPDSTYYGTFQLNMECGHFVILNQHNVVPGDVNANGYAVEVGDVVLLANHMMDPAAWPFTTRQMYASDYNGDGLQATIGDLIAMINALNGHPMYKVVPVDIAATITMPNTYSNVLPISVVSDANVGGAVVSINHTGVELGAPTADGMDLKYSDNGDVMTVVVYNMQSLSFAPGTNTLFTVPVLSEGSVSLGEVSVANGNGALLDARTEIAAPLPIEYSVSQNFPNPFNAKTSIKYALPTSADNVTINIYNVAGQLVQSINEQGVSAGYHSVVWDASDVASGVYFYKVSADDFTKTLKMTLLK